MRIRWFMLLLALGLPLGARGDTLYALWIVHPSGAGQLTRFDGETPGLPELPFPPDPQLRPFSLEFDPTTGKIWGFEYFVCQVLCPSAHDPFVLDPQTGSWAFVHLPGLQLDFLLGLDTDIDPATRELRYFSGSTGNLSYSLDRQENRSDQALNPPFEVVALAHTPAVGGAGNVETYAIGRLASTGRVATGEPWYQLARIGGVDGDPPASSGEVTVIGPIDVEAERLWFDIAANGTAYLAALLPFAPEGEENQLFRVDLGSGALESIGLIAPPSAGANLSGVAVAPPDPGSAVEIPALSSMGLGLFALALCAAALRLSQRSAPRSDR